MGCGSFGGGFWGGVEEIEVGREDINWLLGEVICCCIWRLVFGFDREILIFLFFMGVSLLELESLFEFSEVFWWFNFLLKCFVVLSMFFVLFCMCFLFGLRFLIVWIFIVLLYIFGVNEVLVELFCFNSVLVGELFVVCLFNVFMVNLLLLLNFLWFCNFWFLFFIGEGIEVFLNFCFVL